tara:strand:- start:77 stop:541 length:465 start_codon:yes stop_codon:yes gene_type:complete
MAPILGEAIEDLFLSPTRRSISTTNLTSTSTSSSLTPVQTTSQPTATLTLKRLVKIIGRSSDIVAEERVNFISARLAECSITISQNFLETLATYGRFRKIYLPETLDLLCDILPGDLGIDAVKKMLIEEEGFPKFPELPAELRLSVVSLLHINS